MLGLEAHLLHQPGTLDHVREARIVLDVGGDHELAAGLEAGDQHRFEQRAGGVDRGRVAGRAGADDDELGVGMGHRGVSEGRLGQAQGAAVAGEALGNGPAMIGVEFKGS